MEYPFITITTSKRIIQLKHVHNLQNKNPKKMYDYTINTLNYT